MYVVHANCTYVHVNYIQCTNQCILLKFAMKMIFNVNINIDVAKCTFVQCKLYLSDLLTFLSL